MSRFVKIRSTSNGEVANSFSRAVRVGNFVFTANTGGRNYKTNELADSAAEQLERALATLEKALAVAGATLSDTVKATLSLVDLADKDAVMAVFAKRFAGIDPVFTMICQPIPVPNMKVEIELVAYINDTGKEAERIQMAQ